MVWATRFRRRKHGAQTSKVTSAFAHFSKGPAPTSADVMGASIGTMKKKATRNATKKKAKKSAVTRLVHEEPRERERRPNHKPSPLATTFAALARAFAKAGVRWYVFGAQAAIFYGVARATADIDVTVDLGAMRPSDLVKALASEGFEPVSADAALLRQTRVLPILHRNGLPVDVVLAGPGLEELFFENARTRNIHGVRAPVASAEDLVVMKILAGRPKDLEDARTILVAQRATLDVGRVRELLSTLEQALGQSDLIPLFDRLSRVRA